jgi:hypothetical protein
MTRNEFEKIEIPALVDMLADHTAFYSKMLSEGATAEDIKAYEAKIISLQDEINIRKQALVNAAYQNQL